MYRDIRDTDYRMINTKVRGDETVWNKDSSSNRYHARSIAWRTRY